MNKLKTLLILTIPLIFLQSCGGSYLIADITHDYIRTNWDKKDFGVIDKKLLNKTVYIDWDHNNIYYHPYGSCDHIRDEILESGCFFVVDKITDIKTKWQSTVGSSGLLVNIANNHLKTLWRVNYKITVKDIATNQLLDEWITPYMQKPDITEYMNDYFELLHNEIK
jgi:hypothetical protein